MYYYHCFLILRVEKSKLHNYIIIKENNCNVQVQNFQILYNEYQQNPVKANYNIEILFDIIAKFNVEN